jgi:hypothetical protein
MGEQLLDEMRSDETIGTRHQYPSIADDHQSRAGKRDQRVPGAPMEDVPFVTEYLTHGSLTPFVGPAAIKCKHL